LAAKAKFIHAKSVNLAHAWASMTMWLAKRTRKLLYGVGELFADIERRVFDLALHPSPQRDSHARRRGLVMAAANLAGDS
jgi:hypothetical protein